ncbi:DNA polymerase IV [Psychrobacillus psychrodurans]|uniref:DNA polymerase IV n=1 Tax=Psychrobacillus TaxID=1221880 RepID=UPI001F4D8462|nr:DNA polymerase IV [Psychrobacillus psychrodurans]MCK1998369.1 DNA polymerase IV [Psychrobacillus psychrodurans]
MKKTGRIILHIDLNSFYASVEQVYNPELKGKPIAIAGNPSERRGIIITCSYEARALGVKTTMNVVEAKRRCPELVILPPNFDRYRDSSKRFFNLLREFTSLLEPVSIDEGFLEITKLSENRHALTIAHEIQARIWNELSLPCSIGVAPNKFLAKTASDMKKPMGITILRKRDVPNVLWQLDVIEMHGIGSRTAEKLNVVNIKTIGDLANTDEHKIRSMLGKNGERLRQHANGEDNREVDPNSIYDTKSVGNSMTLPKDITDLYKLRQTIEKLSKKVADRLLAKRLAGKTVIIYIRDADWNNQTRSKTVSNSVQSKEEILDIAWSLFQKYWDESPVRLLGVTVSNVINKNETTKQLTMFNFEEFVKEEPIIQLIDNIEKKFGKGVIQKGIDIGKSSKYQANSSLSKDFLDDHRE